MAQPDIYADHWRRIQQVQIQYPLELFENNGRWVIMDGYHRLARHRLRETPMVPVRMHDRALMSSIRALGPSD